MKINPQNIMRSMVSVFSMSTLLAFMPGCHPNKSSQEPTSSLDTTPIPVATITVKESDIPIMTSHLGTVQSVQHAVVQSRLNANVTTVEIKVGDSVSKGDILIRLDDREWKAALDKATAEANRAKADWTRFQKLLAEGSVTQREADQIRTTYESAEANLDAASTRLSHARIKAPFDGVIERIDVEAGEGVGIGQSLVAIEHTGRLEVRTHLPMQHSAGLKIGESLTISFQNKTIQGTITELQNVADPNTRTVEAVLAMPQETKWRPGETVRVMIHSTLSKEIWIPTQSIRRKGQLEFVFLVKDSTASMRLIKSGKQQPDNGLTQILSGLETDEALIISPLKDLEDGLPVIIEKTSSNLDTTTSIPAQLP